MKISILCFDGISSLHLSVPCAVFQDALFAQESPIELSICSEHIGLIQLSSGFSISTEKGLNELKEAEVIVIPSWLPEEHPSAALTQALQEAVSAKKILVGLCLGSYVLGYLGLLDGQEATTHWAYAEDFQKRFPKALVKTDPLYIDNGNIITSAGSAAGFDCCLHLLTRFFGAQFANQVARNLVMAPHREGGQNQFIQFQTNPTSTDEMLNKTLKKVRENLHETYYLDELANQSAMSPRTFSRKFNQQFGCSFTQWLANERLKFSQHLLETTNNSMIRIADLCGFGTDENLRKHFKKQFGISPNAWRKKFKSANKNAE